MPEESTTPDLVELARGSLEAANSGDVDRMMSFFDPDAVWHLGPVGIGTFEGLAAIRGFFEEWFGAYEEYAIEAEEIRDLANGVILSVNVQKGRPAGSTGFVRFRYATVTTWGDDGLIALGTSYGDVDEARAAAERLAELRG